MVPLNSCCYDVCKLVDVVEVLVCASILVLGFNRFQPDTQEAGAMFRLFPLHTSRK